MKKHRWLFTLGFVVALLAVGYSQLSESQKRFVQNLARQSPYLIPRYFV